jgi:hypothetical protein
LVILETEYTRYREDRRQSTLDKKKTKSKK